MSDTFHSAAPDELEGFALARLISRLGVDHVSACTFLWDEREALAPAWEIWLRDLFTPILAPAFATSTDLDKWLDPAIFRRLALPYSAGWLAAQAFVKYRRAGRRGPP